MPDEVTEVWKKTKTVDFVVLTFGFILLFVSPVFFYAKSYAAAAAFLMLGAVIIVMSFKKKE